MQQSVCTRERDMLGFLSRTLIRDYENTENPDTRQAYGMLCGGVGIFLNFLLFLGKLIAGLVSGSIAITADAVNNLSDAGSSVITLVGFRLSGQKPDSEHPFGHGRMEYLAGFLVSVIIVVMAVELMKSSVSKIMHPEPIQTGALILAILILSILVKIYMYAYNRSIGKKIESETLHAAANDSLSDTIATFVVLISALLARFTDVQVDGWCGAVVAVFVFLSGIGTVKDTVNPLLGEAPPQEFVDRVEAIVMEYREQGIVGMHDLVVHNYGAGRTMISLHAEVPSDSELVPVHELIDTIEHRLMHELSCSAVIHMDPVRLNDPLTDEVKEKVSSILTDIDPRISFHDFRMVHCAYHTKVIFDLELPFDYPVPDADVIDSIQRKVWEIDHSYYVKIDVDNR